VIAENCPHCPRLLIKSNSGGDCYDPEEKDHADAEMARVPFDSAFARLNYALYLKSRFDIVAVLTMSRFSKRSYAEGVLDSRLFPSGTLPKMQSVHHPVWSLKKVSGLLKLVSAPTPTASTKPKAQTDVKFSSSSSLGSNEENMLAYKLVETFLRSLSNLTGEHERDLDQYFSILEASARYRPMFRLKYSNLRSSKLYKTLTPEIVSLAKNDKSVAIALSKVLSLLINVPR
jgi:hypothetical protein